MKHILSKYIILAVLLFSFMLISCTGYGKLSLVSRNETDDLLEDLLSRTDQYVIHYHGTSENIVSGLLFDPQKDDRHIQPEGHMWHEIKDTETIAAVANAIQRSNFPNYFPNLYEIISPEGDFYGYLFTGWLYIAIRQDGEQTVRLFGLKGPPEYED